MPFLLLLGLFVPRVVIAYLWFFTLWFRTSFPAWWWALIGFIFMPYTTLWYGLHTYWYDSTWTWWHIVIMIIAVVTDLSAHNATGRR